MIHKHSPYYQLQKMWVKVQLFYCALLAISDADRSGTVHPKNERFVIIYTKHSPWSKQEWHMFSFWEKLLF